MQKVKPKVIEDVGFDFSWSEKKVWALSYPVLEVPMKELRWHFDIPFWNKPNGGYYDLTPNEVLANPEKYQEEYKRILNADLSHPVDIMTNKGRWLILDGLHRLVKFKMLNKDNIKVRKIPREAIPQIRA